MCLFDLCMLGFNFILGLNFTKPLCLGMVMWVMYDNEFETKGIKLNRNIYLLYLPSVFTMYSYVVAQIYTLCSIWYFAL